MTAHIGEGYNSLAEMYAAHGILFNIAIAYICILCGLVFTFRNHLPSLAGQRLAGAASPSNLDREFEYSADQPAGQALKVLSLWVYPVKGCRGIELDSSEILETGFKHDRQLVFAIRDTPSSGWVFASQRGYPRMAVLHTSIDSAANTVTISYPTKATSFPANYIFGDTLRKSFTVPLNVNIYPEKEKFPVTTVKVWGDLPEAYNLSAYIPEECKNEIFPKKRDLEREVGLFAVINGNERVVKADCVKELERPAKAGFADIFPMHMIGLASVRALNKLVAAEVPKLSARRFRPNVIVTGSPAYDEDDWKFISIGTKQYHIVARTPRCKVPNNDPDTGERNRNEPDVTMRKKREIDVGAPSKGCMGMHVVPKDIFGIIKVGDEIIVHERTDKHRFG